MSPIRSGMCLGDDLPRLHTLCKGTFTQSAGEMELSRTLACGCDCHRPGTALHRLIRGQGQSPAAARQN